MPTDYEHDVFLSYLREHPCGSWVLEHFLPLFEFQLGNALNRRAKVFIDKTGIHSGEKWPAALKLALACSRCLVGIWTPLYFRSEWCQNESEIMLNRETKMGYGTIKHPNGLIIGVRVNDGIFFPKYAKDTQRADFEPYFYVGQAFTQCPLYIPFQAAIKSLAADVAQIIAAAPPWSEEWLSAPWNDDVIAKIQKSPTPRMAQPLIT